MTLEEIKEKKKILRKDILTDLTKFYEETGQSVTDLCFRCVTQHSRSGENIFICYELEIEVKI